MYFEQARNLNSSNQLENTNCTTTILIFFLVWLSLNWLEITKSLISPLKAKTLLCKINFTTF